jgi:hypothetical protein
MSSAIVQFIRNFLCCIKDLSFGAHHQQHHHQRYQQINLSWMYNNTLTNQYMNDYFNLSLIEPIKYTTPLEMIISITQFYVVLTGVPESIQRFLYSYYQMKRSYALIRHHQSTNNPNIGITNHVERLLYASLLKETNNNIRSMFVAFNCFCISIAFIWLSANSLHITTTTWIGGLPALIHALTVMNLCLIPLLYYMYIDSKEYYQNSKRIQLFHQQLLVGTVTAADIGLSAIQALYNNSNEYIPFYSCNSTRPVIERFNNVDDIQLLNHERRTIQALLDIITGTTAITKKTDENNENNDNYEEIRMKIQKDIANTTSLPSIVYKFHLYSIREFVYCILNFIAWYGYGMCIVVYYYPNTIFQSDIVHLSLLHFNHDDADWYGNFIGDSMWTIEPLIILFSPILIHQLTTTSRQRQSTTTSIPNLITSVVEQNEKSKIE